ncbi:MAG: thiamine diphosphokinase [bacterium]|nr:thiamine diphosphokinase [bacterium]
MKQHSWLDALLPDRIDALLIAGGAAPNKRLLRSIAKRAEQLIAIDGGIRHVRSFGLIPRVVIGDLDSAAPQDLAWARGKRARVVYVREQESADIEKGLRYCARKGLTRIIVAGIEGDRPDHFLNALGAVPRIRGLHASFLFSSSIGLPLSGRRTLHLALPCGTGVSWLGAPRASGCTINGVQWPFTRRVLEFGKFQSLSNRATDAEVVVTQHSGMSLIIIPVFQE